MSALPKSTSLINGEMKKVLISSSKSDTANTTEMSAQGKSVKNDISRRRVLSRIIENFVVVWLNGNINESNIDYQNSIAQLRRIFSSIKTFTIPDECVAFLTAIQDLKVFLILSSAFCEILVSHIHDLSQIDSIYIFCDNETKHDQWTKDWIKVKGVFTDISFICDQLKRNTRQCEQNLTPISIISSSSTTDFNELDPSFMYS